MNIFANNSYIVDLPISSIDGDSFSRKNFCQNLIEMLLIKNQSDSALSDRFASSGVVIGLHGGWGSGKSTVINFVCEIASSIDPIIIIKFYPWMVQNEVDLISYLFSQIIREIDQRLSGSAVEGRKLKRAFAKFGEAAGWLTTAGTTLAGVPIPGLGNLAKAMKGEDKDFYSVMKSRKLLEEAISESNIPIIITIDEIDRLEDSEIRMVMKIVKSVFDIKGISFLLAYDLDRVIQALSQSTGSQWSNSNGVKYLEKVVNIHIPMPLLFESERKKIVMNELVNRSKIYNFKIKKRDNIYIDNLLDIILERMILTPRDIVRLFSTYDFYMKGISGQKNWLDYLAYSCLCVKCPHVVAQIFDHPQELTVGEKSSVDRVFDARRYNYCDVELANRYDYKFNSPSESNLFAFIFERFVNNSINDDVKKDRLSKSVNLARIMRSGVSFPDL